MTPPLTTPGGKPVTAPLPMSPVTTLRPVLVTASAPKTAKVRAVPRSGAMERRAGVTEAAPPPESLERRSVSTRLLAALIESLALAWKAMGPPAENAEAPGW